MNYNSNRSFSPRRGSNSSFRGRGKPAFNGRRNNFQKPRFTGSRIDPNRFIKKAAPVTTAEEYTPQNSFSDFPIDQALKRNIEQKGYTTPTPIQDQAILPALEGRDIIGIANTGTGKTAAFLVPLINRVVENRTSRVLIVTPTRELALQINEELKAFAKGMKIYSTLCIGGGGMGRQIKEVRQNPHFIIGTPGRLKDLIKQNVLQLQYFTHIVLDEVDRMVDIGFIKDVRYLVSLLPQQRQSLFFSATVSGEVQQIVASFVKNPVTISVKSQETAENIEQDIVKVNGRNKTDVLEELLKSHGFDKVLIFGRTKWGVQKLSNMLLDKGFRAAAIHGNKSQSQRQRALEQFKRNEIQVLLATDVVARGLDIDNVSHVINFDQPNTYNDYVHRIGRTGRANKKGIALTFVD